MGLSYLPALGQLLQLPFLSSFHPSSPDLNQQSSFTFSCPNAQLSCHNTSAVVDTCCFNYPGGQFLQTQFWDTSPAIGPADSWTIHGLWPDHCNGGFDQFCDNDRKYSNISDIISSFDGSESLIDFMSTYWLANGGSDESLWSHEWNKHGTCISTLDAKCYIGSSSGKSSPSHRYVLDYFNVTATLFKSLNTYATLAQAGIHPSTSQRYSLADLQNAIISSHGNPVTLRCHSGELNEIWYHFDTRGSIQTGQFVPASPDGTKSNCPSTGIRYLPKSTSSNPTSTGSHVAPAPTSTTSPDPFVGKGQLHIYQLSTSTFHGCLIRSGQWYTSGSCAVYTSKSDVVDPGHASLFTLSSRYAPCAINEANVFECDKTLPYQTIFSALDDKLVFRNESAFYADKIPGRFEKVHIFAKGAEDDSRIQRDDSEEVEVEIRWVSST